MTGETGAGTMPNAATARAGLQAGSRFFILPGIKRQVSRKLGVVRHEGVAP